MGLNARKTCFQEFANNKDADQSVHAGSLLFAYWKV